jgi:hypothetical protein
MAGSMFDAKSKYPYLIPSRLADVIAAIQAMANSERSSLPCAIWAENISGTPDRADHWRNVFDAHTELFRKSPNDHDHYALIWRRSMPRRFYRPTRTLLSEPEFAALTPDQQALASRPPIPDGQVKTLVDIAITLHARQTDQRRDWRWWIPIGTGFLGSVVGGVIVALSK